MNVLVGMSHPFPQGYDVLVRADYKEHKEDKVAIICGGGSGHEPAHFGFIGTGMLSGAVAGLRL